MKEIFAGKKEDNIPMFEQELSKIKKKRLSSSLFL